MSGLVWAAIILLVVPIQVAWIHHIAINDVRPDICLALACLLGFLRGERHGLLLGLSIGFAQDLASTGDLWLNMLTKGAGGMVAGLVGRRLVQGTMLSFVMLVLSVSCLSGVLFLFAGRSVGTFADEFVLVRSVLLPQAAYDSVFAAGLYWLLAGRLGTRGETEGQEASVPHVLSVK